MERRSILQAFAAMPFMGMFKVKKVATIEDVAIGLSEAFDSTPHGNLEMYEVGGQVIFPIYAESGGISSKYIFYIFKRHKPIGASISGGELGRPPARYTVLGVEDHLSEYRDFEVMIKAAINKFDRLAHGMSEATGDLGRGITRRELLSA
jgi:hypothetical protein